MLRRVSLRLSVVTLSLFLAASVWGSLGGCATTTPPATQDAKDPASQASKSPEEKSPAPAPAASTSTPEPTAATQRVDGNALAGAWRGKDARDIIGVMNLCADGSAKIVIDGKSLGGQAGTTVTWSASEVRPAEARIVLRLAAKEAAKDIIFLARREGVDALKVALIDDGDIERIEDAPPNNLMNLARDGAAPVCAP